jgi:hypothetical protein
MLIGKYEQIVIDHVLVLHPKTHLTIPALVGEILAGCTDFSPGDELERAVRDLVCAGSLYCEGGCVFPSASLLRREYLSMPGTQSVLTGQRSSI